MSDKPTIAVIGAGMVGTCCALHLQNAGFEVTLVDREGPGEQATYGNLGNFGIASCPPAAMPGTLKKVPKWLFDDTSPLKIRWGYLPRALPWFLRFVANSRPHRVEENAAARQSLLNHAHAAFDPLVAEAGAQEFMSQTGIMLTFESEEVFQASQYAFDLRRRNGVEFDLLDGNEARQIQPALTDKVVRAYRIAKFSHTVDPMRLTQALAQSFERKGGTVLRRAVTGFTFGDNGVSGLRTEGGVVPVERVVVAAGVWSRELAKMLGVYVPLEAERGYHTMYLNSETRLNGTIMSVDRYVVAAPMQEGVRVGGLAEFAGVNAPPNYEVTGRIRRHAQGLLPGLKEENTRDWMGPRPSHPDSKPVISRAPFHPNVYLAFGHDHLGLTMGGITGQLVAELATDQPTTVDLEPFRSDRF